MSIFSLLRFAIALAIAGALSVTTHGQSLPGMEPTPGKLVGTVTDVNGDPVPHATVTIETLENDNLCTLVTPENGFFEFNDLTGC